VPERIFLIESERDEVRRECDEVRRQVADLTADKQAKKIVKDSVPRPRSMKAFTPTELRDMMGLGDNARKKEWNVIKVGS
jgi:1,4-dihydroxy-2-naphthoyl-CoA synthase